MAGRQATNLGFFTPFIACACLCASVLLMAVSPDQASAAGEEHIFDPTLSLRGDCSLSEFDKVPDPGPCPGTAGVDHPPKAFNLPCGPATDPHGDIYVSSAAVGNGGGTEGRIDIFNPQGEYLTEILDAHQPCSIAVDSEGHVYASEYAGKNLVRFDPKAYPPKKGDKYSVAQIISEPIEGFGTCTSAWSVVVDPSDDHVYAAMGCSVFEFDSATGDNVILTKNIAEGLAGEHRDLAINGVNHDLYVAGKSTSGPLGQPRVFVLDGADYTHTKCAIDGSETPDGGLGSEAAGLAVDQSNGDVYVDDVLVHGVVDQFGADCHYISQIDYHLKPGGVATHGAGLAVDDPLPSQVDYDSPNEGEVYVTQGENSSSYHLYAFSPPREPAPPLIEDQTASGVASTEAILEAELNPEGAETKYQFEYLSQSAFEANGNSFAGPEPASSSPVPPGNAGSSAVLNTVSAPVSNLTPDTAYRFRLVATSHCNRLEPAEECVTVGEGTPGGVGEDATFSTYAAEIGLPDGRAYELVTPPDTNGRIPTMGEFASSARDGFDTSMSKGDGDGLVFGVEGGSLPGLGGGGFHDTYEALRTPGGWQSHFTGVSAALAEEPFAGGISDDRAFSFWNVSSDRGDLAKGDYLRGPGGGFELIGIGELGADPNAQGRLITPGSDRVVFSTESLPQSQPVRLESEAPSGVGTVYARTPGGDTKVLSLPPADAPPATLQEFELNEAEYLGASRDGAAVAFEVNGTLYVRVNGLETLGVASGNPRFAGISQDGARIFFLRPNASEPLRPNPPLPTAAGVPQGDLYSYDVATHATTAIGSGEETVVANISSDGTHAYFVSHKELEGNGQAGDENLYYWDASNPASVQFIGTLTERDVIGEPAKRISSTMTNGLGRWIDAAVYPERSPYNGLGADPSRTTPDGTVLVFESRAQLTEDESDGHAEIYRYDTTAGEANRLVCVSCNPTGAPSETDAQLQTPPGGQFAVVPPVNNLTLVRNLTTDGGRVYFQSRDRLASSDVDGKQDVYEWEADGIGGCAHGRGCVHLISSGHSATDDYLYSVSPNGSDVFFESGDRLVPQDLDQTPSIYGARAPHVPGETVGFPPPTEPAGSCVGEACQPESVAPADFTPGSASFEAGNSRKPCRPKSKAHQRAQAKKQCGAGHGRHRKHRKHKQTRAGGRPLR